MPRQSSKTISILVLISIFLVWVVPALSQAESPEGQPSAQGTLANFVYLPMVADLNPWLHPMAVETHRDLIDGSLITTRLGELNAGWVRLSARVSWRSMQPNENDPINWSLLADTENELRLLKQMGIKPVLVINDSPHWATVYPSSCSAIRSDKFEAYASFLEQLVSRWKTPEFDVHDWELGNEPEVDPELIPPDSAFGCWGEIDDPYYGGQHYGEMLKYVAPRIRNADPQAKIWTGGLILSTPETTNPDLGHPENFIRGVLESGAAPYFDILPFHGHTRYWGVKVDSEMYLSGVWSEEWGGGIRGKVKYLREIMDQYDVKKPLVINEVGVGCQTVPDVVNCEPLPEEYYEFKADMLIRIAARVLADDVKGFTWYTLEGPGWRYQGLLDDAFNPQQAFAAYQELNNQIQDTSYLGPVGYHPNIEAYAFQRGPDEILVILWTKEDIVQDIAIPVASFIGARMRLGYNIVDIIPQPVGTDYMLSVGFSPIFLTLRP